MYGLIAIFDERTEELIKNIWKELKEKSISTYAYEVEDRKPHITLASYNSLNKKEFIEQMDITYKNQTVIDIKFNIIGSFLNSGALFFSPTVTKDLIEIHSNHHKDFERFNDNPNSLYLPDNWIPHCTIANRLSEDKLNEVFNYCSTRYSTILGKIVNVALIDVSEKHKAPIIHSIELKHDATLLS
ncbi:2'-5' RNA ligase family protein [Salinibacillus xinjiangensis]|uniref:2'-5' RNA ligase family protein n=1 Tax=Salinibacillus xinjiangensis TaxID=1229268 RepID=A0A6G1X4Z0_9BACI|nr:2'-5' RNA ligase family protein [Salinibacillus xinjiangensis]MRG86007.1 2'-5' RNA ligase family protein [Salinibacillus xinjiangensis]